MRHNRDTRGTILGSAKPTCASPPHFQVRAYRRAASRQDTHEFAPFRSDLDTKQTQEARAAQTQVSDLQLVELVRAGTLANLGHLPCLSARLPDLGSPGFASVCHLPVRDVCEVPR